MQKKYAETLDFIRGETNISPEILLILGSGFSKIAEKVDVANSIPYEEIPHFKTTDTATHENNLVFGTLAGKNIMIMQGRLHAYEGLTLSDITYPVRIAGRLGVKQLITTNLSGGINKALKLGDLMVVQDHINVSGTNPLQEFSEKREGHIFTDMFEAYSPRLIKLLEKAASKRHITLKRGVLAYLTGPSFETPAELRFLKMIGADAVGWSIVPEAIVARSEGIEVLGICCISDLSDPDTLKPVDLEELFNIGLNKTDDLHGLLETLLGTLE